MRKPTLQDIGSELGLSHATVSRALSDHPQVSQETKARVRAVAERIGYIVNGSARALRGTPTSLVGLVIPDVQNSFFAQVAKIVAETLASQAYGMVLSVTEDDPERERRDLRALVEARVAGVIAVFSATPLDETLQLAGQLKVVQLLRRNRRILSDVVAIDDHEGTYQSTRHLIELGHRAIAYIGNPAEPNTGRARMEGFMDACTEASITVPPDRIALGAPRPGFGKQAAGRVMGSRPRPTGIVTGGVEQVLGVLQWLNENGLRCPRDVSLVGFGDSPWFELIQGGVTTVHLPVSEVGSAAAGLLLQRVIQQDGSIVTEGAPTVASYSPTLIVRGTSGPRTRVGRKP